MLPTSGTVVEVASGTGEHAVYMAAHLPALTWQPSDLSDEARDSIDAWRESDGTDNMLPPLALDTTSDPWPIEHANAIVCINMVHISPWQATEGLLRGAARLLAPGAVLYLYGPYHVTGRPTAPSNLDFDANLRARNPAWGLRDVEAVQTEARALGFALDEVIDMPGNNYSLIFRKRPKPS